MFTAKAYEAFALLGFVRTKERLYFERVCLLLNLMTLSHFLDLLSLWRNYFSAV